MFKVKTDHPDVVYKFSKNIMVKEGGTGKILGSGSFGVTVVKGDPALVSDIRLDLAGLVDDEPAPIAEESTARRKR